MKTNFKLAYFRVKIDALQNQTVASVYVLCDTF